MASSVLLAKHLWAPQAVFFLLQFVRLTDSRVLRNGKQTNIHPLSWYPTVLSREHDLTPVGMFVS